MKWAWELPQILDLPGLLVDNLSSQFARWHPLTLQNKVKECPVQGNIIYQKYLAPRFEWHDSSWNGNTCCKLTLTILPQLWWTWVWVGLFCMQDLSEYLYLTKHYNDHLIISCNHYFDSIIQPVPFQDSSLLLSLSYSKLSKPFGNMAFIYSIYAIKSLPTQQTS